MIDSRPAWPRCSRFSRPSGKVTPQRCARATGRARRSQSCSLRPSFAEPSLGFASLRVGRLRRPPCTPRHFPREIGRFGEPSAPEWVLFVPPLRFNDIADRILEYDPSCDLALLQRAYVFSAKVHEGQERLSGEPYL